MSNVFTRYIQALEPGREPDPQLFEAFWSKVKALLKREIRRRNLWTAPPSYLGIPAPNWSDADALEDLATDAYLDLLHHLSGLKAQLQNHQNIDGYVMVCIRNFVHQRQRTRDPVGYRVFEILQIAVRRLCEEGRLYVVAGDIRISNDTFLSGQQHADAESVDVTDFSDLTGEWIDDLLPDLVTAHRKSKPATALAERVVGLVEDGVRVFRFRDLVSALKHHVRGRWQALLHSTGFDLSETYEWVPVIQPSNDFEERERFEALILCVEGLLEKLKNRAKTHEYLTRLWSFLRFLAAESDSSQLPSYRGVSKELRIPRERVPGLLETLGTWLKRCLEANGGLRAGSEAPVTS